MARDEMVRWQTVKAISSWKLFQGMILPSIWMRRLSISDPYNSGFIDSKMCDSMYSTPIIIP